MRSAVESAILAAIQSASYEHRCIGDASIGTLFVDMTWERNTPMTLDDAKEIFNYYDIEHNDSDAEELAGLLTPVVFEPKGSPSYVFMIASLNDAGFVNWETFATRADLDRAWAKCEAIGQQFECGEC